MRCGEESRICGVEYSSLTLYVFREPLADRRQGHCPAVAHNYVHRHGQPVVGERRIRRCRSDACYRALERCSVCQAQ